MTETHGSIELNNTVLGLYLEIGRFEVALLEPFFDQAGENSSCFLRHLREVFSTANIDPALTPGTACAISVAAAFLLRPRRVGQGHGLLVVFNLDFVAEKRNPP